jgi:hypothetical protein
MAMSPIFVERLFRQQGQDFKKRLDGTLDAEFRSYDKSVFVMGFSEIQRDVAQGQIWFPTFDRPVRDTAGLCNYINKLKWGFALEFDPGSKRLGARAYFENGNDAQQEIGNFVVACDFGLRPLSLELGNRGYWTSALVLGYMTCFSYGKLN